MEEFIAYLRKIIVPIVLVGLVIVCFFPIFYIVLTSFKPADLVFSMPPVWIFKPTLKAYYRVFELVPDFPTRVFNSTVVAVVSTFFATTIGTLAAYALSRFEIKAKEHFAFFILSTRFAPPVGFVVPFYLIFSEVALIDTLTGLFLVHIMINLSFTVWMMRGIFDSIPVEYEEAAMVDGMTRFQALRRIVLPAAKGGIAATAIFAMIMSWNEFVFALTLCNLRANTLPIALPKLDQMSIVQWEVVCACGTMIIIPMVLFTFLGQRYLIRGLTMGTVRG
ncbi:MAG: carbohydrate ABC transporter permease [Desulfobacterales bacterium]|nr:MAG: carbohydrate ABC transporter permease [Desulfobacterales bacterium]